VSANLPEARALRTGPTTIDTAVTVGMRGVFTVVFTDVEDSTRLWEEHPEDMEGAVRAHNELIGSIVGDAGGRVLRLMGDGVLAVFLDATEALAAAVDIQRAFTGRSWPGVGELRLRIGINTGPCRVEAGELYGRAPNLAARLESAAHGGQILLSDATAQAARGAPRRGEQLFELGRYHIRGFDEPAIVHSIVAEGLPEVFPPLRTPYLGFDELPADDTTLYGRDRMNDDVTDLLRVHRLVTLWGPGGVGKTRVALRVAHRVRRPFEHGVRFVDLAVTDDPTLVPAAVAATLRAQPTSAETDVDTLLRVLRQSRLLLVLDNCDAVIDGVRDLVATMLGYGVAASVLATSREALRLKGEHTVEVAPLRVPLEGESDPAAIAATQSVTLFVDRARASDPNFAVNDDNAAALATLCRALDGLPLALELAAARLDVETLDDLIDDLPSLFTRLETSAIAATHGTSVLVPLRWNLSRLTADESAFFQRLAVFAGPFTREMALRMTPEPSAAHQAFDRLVRTSVVVRDHDVPDRFRLLSSARGLARADVDPIEWDGWRAQHANLMVERAETHGALLHTDQERDAVEALRADFVDCHDAIAFLLERDSIAPATRMVVALFQFALFQPRPEVYRWASTVAERIDDAVPYAAEALGAAALAAWFGGDTDRAVAIARRAIAVATVGGGSTVWARTALVDALSYAHQLDDVPAQFNALTDELRRSDDTYWKINGLGYEAIGHSLFGRTAAANDCVERALAMARRLDNPDCTHWALFSLGRVLAPNDPDAACVAYEEAMQAAREVENRFNIGLSLVEWVRLRRRRGDIMSAVSGCIDLLDMLAVSGNRSQLSQILRESGLVLADAGRLELAAVVLLSRQGLPEMPRAPHEVGDDDAQLAELRRTLGDAWPQVSIRAKAIVEHELISICRAELADLSRAS
jgi:predicted ATPase/class 3 adenylate cyclase